MLLVGLTGGIGSGKSTVADLLRRKGADGGRRRRGGTGDRRAGAACPRRPGPSASATASCSRTVSLDRPGLARIAFADEESRQALNGITWPAIVDEFGERIDEAPADAIVVCDVPLLAEGGPGSEREYAAVIVVEAPPDAAARPARGTWHRARRRRAADGRAGERRRPSRVRDLRARQLRRRRRARPAGRRRLGRARAAPNRAVDGK